MTAAHKIKDEKFVIEPGNFPMVTAVTQCLVKILKLAFEAKKSIIVRVEVVRLTRTLAQNKMLWLWHGEYAAHNGITKQEAHEHFKRHFVLPLLLREDETGELTELYLVAEQAPDAMTALARLCSSTYLTTKEFSEALNEYDLVSASQGCVFSHPEDLYWRSMGLSKHAAIRQPPNLRVVS